MPTDLSKLTGTINTKRPNSGQPYNIPWSNVARYAEFITEASQRYGAEPERIAAHIVIESDGEPLAVQRNASNGWSYGLMQVVPFGVGWAGWHRRVKDIARIRETADERSYAEEIVDALYDPRINILVGASILADFKAQHGSWDAASSAFFTGGPNWGGSDTVNGTTGKAYKKTLNALMKEIVDQLAGANPPSSDPNPPTSIPQPAMTEQEILALISSNTPGVYISFPFRGLNTDSAGRPVNIYKYGKGHGTTADNMHTGIDIWMPDETPINCVFGGEVVCVGANGRPMWGQGCGYFSDDDGGLGNITILTDHYATIDGKRYQLKMTYGHCSSSLVVVGQKVADGQRIGRSGRGGNFAHVHLDVVINAPERNNPRLWNNPGEYHLVDPIPTIRNAMGAGTVTPQPPNYDAERIDIPQPTEFEGTGWEVTVTASGVPVKQYADPDAPDVARPLAVGDVFTAPYLVFGRDGRPWWISDRRGRVPVAGTRCDALEGVL